MAEEIRPLHESELDQQFNMNAQAFQIPAERVMQVRNRPTAALSRGLFVDGDLRVSLVLFPMQVWFGGRLVPTGGLSGVATPPQWRRQGYIGRLLHATVDEMRERDESISTLYPFDFPFYKHYGWAHASDNHVYTIPTTRLPVVAPSGTWHPLQVGSDVYPLPDPTRLSEADLNVLMGIYDAWAPRYNGMLARDAVWWRGRKLDPRDNLFYWRDPAGKPRAYVRYTFKETGPWQRRLEAQVVALDPAAWQAVLGFLRNHDSQAQEVTLNLPEDSRLLALLDDPRFKIEIDPGFMLRINDVAAALQARGYAPEAAGEIIVQVAEGWVQLTPTTYRMDVSDGRATVTAVTAEPQLSLDARALAQLYSGYLTPRQAADLGLLTVHDPAALGRAQAMFAGPTAYLADFF
ncbi:MAG: GNAT family N-acetyltransferase [Chloroflexota bacterium]|nr:GNAT family N-acetyltransferase [Chloroflexota bacterium]